MATNPNAQLAKLAISIVSVAALAGVAGRFASGKAAPQAADETMVTPPAADSTAVAAAPTPAPARGKQRTEFKRKHDDDHDDHDDHEEDEDDDDWWEHSLRDKLSFLAPSAPSSSSGNTTAPSSSQGNVKKVRTRHS